MNELVILLDDKGRRGWLKCSYCDAEGAFTYDEVGYATVAPEAIPVADWINGHRDGTPPFRRCSAAAWWESNEYQVKDYQRGDRVIRKGWIRVTRLFEIE